MTGVRADRYRPLLDRGYAAGRRMAGWLVPRLWRAGITTGRWIIAYPLLVVTLLLGALIAVGLTAASAEIYEAVAEADGVAALDRPVLDAAVRVRTPRLNAAVTAFTDLGGSAVLPALATVAAAGLAAWRRRWTPVVLMAMAGAGSLLMTVVGKHLIGRVRPALSDAVAPYEASASFPSGHSLNTVVLAGVAAYLLATGQRGQIARVLTVGAATAFAVAMGLSRVYLGHHWLTDVLVSWTLGLAWLSVVIVVHRLYLAVPGTRRWRPARPRRHPDAQRRFSQ